jgi:hypothetical protein
MYLPRLKKCYDGSPKKIQSENGKFQGAVILKRACAIITKYVNSSEYAKFTFEQQH